MNISAKEIAALREKTGLPMMEVKSALIEAGGNEEKAIEILRKKGMSKSEKRADKETTNGVIDCYVHGGRIGVLVEVLCETDFVARNEDFKNFAHELSLQIAACAPKYTSRDQIPADEISEESEICLLSQPYFRDPKKKVSDILSEIIAKTGEKIVISRFERMELSC